ncbi:MAG: hypothetical protein K5644_01235 [Lachnospiraceae bacterium]|nr:hypothetical protein [Lachnospiraceae bacterium]
MANKKYGKKSVMEHKEATKKEIAVAKVEERMQQRSYFPYINVLLQVFYIIAMFAIIIVNYLYMEIPIVPLCCVVVLEAILGTLLCRIAAIKYWWIQLIIIGIQILLGYAFDRLGFMIFMSLVYAFTLIVMWVRRRTLK